MRNFRIASLIAVLAIVVLSSCSESRTNRVVSRFNNHFEKERPTLLSSGVFSPHDRNVLLNWRRTYDGGREVEVNPKEFLGQPRVIFFQTKADVLDGATEWQCRIIYDDGSNLDDYTESGLKKWARHELRSWLRAN